MLDANLTLSCLVLSIASLACRPYIMDLQSANGTYLNNEKIPESRYVELKAGDVLKFGYSSREYVLLHDQMV